MKLISMHVDDFGGLHNYDYNFEEGLNVILHDNGWGKTTMAAFLKAMLYGYDTKRSKNITENERKRYLPWQGGKYGGSLDFEAKGKRYRIYRTFGETPRFDTAKVVNLDTNASAGFSPDKLGETLFHLDANAFQRSAFINQNGLSIDGAASSIHARLSALVSQANDVAAYDGAISSLTQQIKVFEKTGARGQLGDLTRQIAAKERICEELERDITEQDRARERITQIDVLLSSINQELEEKSKRLDEITGEGKKQEAAQKMFDDLATRIQSIQKQMEQIKTSMGGRIPTASEIDRIKLQVKALEMLGEQIQELEESLDALTAEYSVILNAYGGNLPEAAQLDNIQNIYGELQGILSSAENEVSDEETPEEYEIIRTIVENDPDYIIKLQSEINSQLSFQELVRKLETQKRDVQHEAETWKDKVSHYNGLKSELDRLQAESAEQSQYRPETIDPVVHKLEQLEIKQRSLKQKLSDQEKAIRSEKDSWARKKERYAELVGELSALEKATSGRDAYKPEIICSSIEKLEDIQKRQQTINIKSELLYSKGLTADEMHYLEECPDDLPDITEGNEVLKQYRDAAKRRAELQGLNARLEGERSKAESLATSLSQLEAIPEISTEQIEEPKKTAAPVLIGVGASTLVIGVALAVLIAPAFAIAAVIGVILAALGIVNKSKYQKKAAAYAVQKQTVVQNHEASEKRADMVAHQSEVLASISSLEQQIADGERALQIDETAVSAWLVKWGIADSSEPEATIVQMMEQAEKAKRLKKKREETALDTEYINEQTSRITAERAEIDDAYPECRGKSHSDALTLLRSMETDFKLSADKLKSARKQLSRFLAEIEVEADQLMLEESPLLADFKAHADETEAELESVAKARSELDSKYPVIAGLSYKDALSDLREKTSAYKVIESQLQSASRKEARFFDDEGLSRDDLRIESSPRMSMLTADMDETAETLKGRVKNANKVLLPLELDTDQEHILQALREAEEMLNEYKRFAGRMEEKTGRQGKSKMQAEGLQKQLAAALSPVANRYDDKEIPDRLALIREELNRAKELQRKINDVNADLSDKTAKKDKAKKEVELFTKTFALFASEEQDVISAVFARAKEYSELSTAHQQLDNQRTALERNIKFVPVGASGDDEAEIRAEVAHLKERRDNLLVEYTQKGDAIRQADQSLEEFPDIKQEIHELYAQKQRAQNTLTILKRTIQLITKAKENLANRYLNKVEELFNSYMHVWLSNDTIKGVLDIDFNIAVEENGKAHVAEGYSTGYCDLIDFCMRLALVDTLFENEQPFLILDDPFVNLDAERLEKALELLSAMSVSKQIVYFVCHPIRAVETEAGSPVRSEFLKLAESTKIAIHDRIASGSAERRIIRKSAKELYKITTPGIVLPFRPEKSDYTITNSIFSLSFVPNELAMSEDKAYELFFIDTSGHVLNERQMIEVCNGKLSADRLQFSLNTRDDSGNEFELMVRECGQDDHSVVARIPFRAKLAFSGTINFDF